MVINGQKALVMPSRDGGWETTVGNVVIGVFPTYKWADEAAAYAASELCDKRRRHVPQVA